MLLLALWLPAAALAGPTRVVILDFEGRHSGGSTLADAVELELELAEGVVLVPRRQLADRLARGRQRLSAESLSQALRGADVDVVLSGRAQDSADGPTIEVRAFNRAGEAVFTEVFTLTADEPDADTLAPLIADSLREAIAGGLRAESSSRRQPEADRDPGAGRRPITDAKPAADDDTDLFVDDDELPGGDADPAPTGRRAVLPPPDERPAEPARGSGWGDRYRDEGGDGDRGGERTERGRDGNRDERDSRAGRDGGRGRDWSDDSGRDARDRNRDEARPRRRLLDEEEDEWDRRVITPVEREERRPSVGDIDAGKGDGERSGARALIPYVAAGAAFDLLYWSYALDAAVGSSQVPWSPLQPMAGGSLRLEVWPIAYVGLDAQARLGKVQVDLSGIPRLDQQAIEIYFYEVQAHVRGQYVLETGWPGFAAGARLGYRLLIADAAPQSPYTVVPGYTAHMLAPGLDLRLPLHPQYAVVMVGAEVIPFAAYAEVPDEPGTPGSASVFGFRVDAMLRSVIAYGIFAELRFFYEDLYLDYQGSGTRLDVNGNAVAEGKVVTGLRGLSLGVGWSY